MSRDYRVWLTISDLDALPRSGKRRKAVTDFIKGLGSIAHLGGDFQVRDSESSRTFEVSTVAGFAVTWWIDGPAEEVKIINVREMR